MSPVRQIELAGLGRPPRLRRLIAYPLGIAMLFLSGCRVVEPASESATGMKPLASAPVSGELPFGLQCDKCMAGQKADCSLAAAAPAIVLVAGADGGNSIGSCFSPGNGEFQSCGGRFTYRFRELRFLKNEVGAERTDSFSSSAAWEPRYGAKGPNSMPAPDSSGVRLSADKRYILFISPSRQLAAAPPIARFTVSVACEVSEFEDAGVVR
jgi:hypothetical protein